MIIQLPGEVEHFLRLFYREHSRDRYGIYSYSLSKPTQQQTKQNITTKQNENPHTIVYRPGEEIWNTEKNTRLLEPCSRAGLWGERAVIMIMAHEEEEKVLASVWMLLRRPEAGLAWQQLWVNIKLYIKGFKDRKETSGFLIGGYAIN